VTVSRVAALALCAVAGLSLAATFVRDTTTPVDVGVTEYEWNVAPGTVPVGTVVFNVHNDGDFVHDFSISGYTTRPLKSRESATLTVVFAQPGNYTYNSTWDDVDREMWGTFTVTGTPLATTTAPPPTTTAPPTQPLPALPLRHVDDVPLPGGSSRFDYQSFDPTTKRLYISHLGADSVIVFDVRSRRVLGVVPGVSGAHGVLAVPALGRVYATATDTQELVAIRGLSVVSRTRVGGFPDGLAYDPLKKRVFVSDKNGGAELVIDLRGRLVRKVRFGGEAGNVKYDAGAKRMLVAVAGREQLASIDPARLRVVARTPLPGCNGAHGLQLDAARRLAFVACERNARLLVVDLKRRRVIQTFTVGAVPDVLALDASLHRLYVAAESGVVAVFAEQGRKLLKLGQALLAPTAHSVAVDPSTHLVYFPLENVGGGPVLRIMAPVRAAMRSR
jgi:DNA-binding beta-propeller fold protein YncE